MSPVWAPMLLDSLRRSCFSRKKCKKKQYFQESAKPIYTSWQIVLSFVLTILWSCREVRLFLIELDWKERDFSCTLDQRKSEHKFRCKNCFTSNLDILGTRLYLKVICRAVASGGRRSPPPPRPSWKIYCSYQWILRLFSSTRTQIFRKTPILFKNRETFWKTPKFFRKPQNFSKNSKFFSRNPNFFFEKLHTIFGQQRTFLEHPQKSVHLWRTKGIALPPPNPDLFATALVICDRRTNKKKTEFRRF